MFIHKGVQVFIIHMQTFMVKYTYNVFTPEDSTLPLRFCICIKETLSSVKSTHDKLILLNNLQIPKGLFKYSISTWLSMSLDSCISTHIQPLPLPQKVLLIPSLYLVDPDFLERIIVIVRIYRYRVLFFFRSSHMLQPTPFSNNQTNCDCVGYHSAEKLTKYQEILFRLQSKQGVLLRCVLKVTKADHLLPQFPQIGLARLGISFWLEHHFEIRK